MSTKSRSKVLKRGEKGILFGPEQRYELAVDSENWILRTWTTNEEGKESYRDRFYSDLKAMAWRFADLEAKRIFGIGAHIEDAAFEVGMILAEAAEELREIIAKHRASQGR
ncbi:MAG: hypothetical protein KAJ19_25485 [Gammaproteobacteria bacterium]|nr:hypothetical protein [Gammaproteobacteria bacterium]